jgi:hypothetical protein
LQSINQHHHSLHGDKVKAKTYEINPNGIALPAIRLVKVARRNSPGIQPVRVAFYFFGRVRGAHVDDVWVLAQRRPFGLDDALEVLGVAGQDVLVDLEDGGGGALAGAQFEDFAAEAGEGLGLFVHGYGYGYVDGGWWM